MQQKNFIKIAGFGSPIVDTFLIEEEEPELCRKIKKCFKLHMSINDDFEWDIYNQIFEKSKIELLVGGSALNVTRMTNFILSLIENRNCETYFFGSTSDDKFGKIIVETMQSENVLFYNQIFRDSLSCSNIVLLSNKDRKFFTNLGVSASIQRRFIEEYSDIFKNLKLFYTDSYLIYRCKDIYNHIYQTYYDNQNLMMALGMGSDTIVNEYFDLIYELLPYVDIILINSEENEILKNKFNKTDMSDDDFIKFLANLEKKCREKNRIIVNTRGSKDTLICAIDFQSNVTHYFSVPVIQIEMTDIVDLNGAGDAFAGGFFGGLLNGINYQNCVRLGNIVASEVLKIRGFQIPKETIKNIKNILHSFRYN